MKNEKVDLGKVSTKELTKELMRREGIEALILNPHDFFTIKSSKENISDFGPATSLINRD